MTPRMSQLQSQALALRALPGVKFLYRIWYALGSSLFVKLTLRASAQCGHVVRAVYLRRGGGRDELLPGASDLDYFLVLETLPAEREMAFLKAFWRRYRFWRRAFPFLGEVLMGDENELRQWLATPAVRAYEARFSWRLLHGPEIRRADAEPAITIDPRDSFSEALKHYADLLQPLIKLRDEQFHGEIPAHSPGGVKLRHAAKAALDLFRLHRGRSLPNAELAQLWRMPRAALARALPESAYGSVAALLPLLRLEGPLFPDTDPFTLFSGLAHRAATCLHEMAEELRATTEEACTPSADWQVSYGSRLSAADPYSQSVRELFAERMLVRHEPVLTRAVLAEASSHMYFSLAGMPSLEKFREILLDLRDVSFSFDRFSVAMPITEATFRELARTSLLDSPFHSFASHREILADEAGAIRARPYLETPVALPHAMLQKTFAELSFALRFQPRELGHFLDKMVALVLGLRLAAEHREISTDLALAIERFGERYPNRVVHLNELISPYLPVREGPARDGSARLASDAWINLTPFLRMEMNAMKDRYFPERPSLKI